MNLLTLVQQTSLELGITSPLQVATSQDPGVLQMYALINRLGSDLSRRFVWQELDKEYLLTTVDGQAGYDLPSDWLRQIEGTEWDRANRWPLNGPKSAQEWQNFKSGIIYAGPRLRFRIQNNQIVLNPTPTSVATLSMEYISKNWVVAADGSTKSQFTLDSDSCVFDDSLMIEGLKMRWNKAKGFAFDESTYNELLAINQAQNKSAPTLSLSQNSGSVLLSTANISDGTWPGA